MENLAAHIPQIALWLAIAVAALASIAILAGRNTLFWLTDLSYTFPVLGKLARFSRDYAKSDYDGWLNVEDTLCRDYAKHVAARSLPEFENNLEYLRLTYDHGRKPMPHGILLLLALLVILEGLGFSYLLGSLLSFEASENKRTLLMIATVSVLAAILLWTTHSAGHQLYRTGVLRSCFQQFQTRKSEGFTSQIVDLSEIQSIDADHPSHVRCANRVVSRPDDRGNYIWVWIAAFLIVVVAVGSTVLRIDTLSSVEAQDAQSVPAALFPGNPQPAAAPASPDAGVEARHDAAVVGFGILSAIFIVTQAVGMHVGYRYGFAGKQGEEAFRATGGNADYWSYWAPIQHRMDVANGRLHSLQRKLEARAPHELYFGKNFFDFIREERGRGARHLHLPPEDRSFEVRYAEAQAARTKTGQAPELQVVADNLPA